MTKQQTNKIVKYLKKWDELLSHDGLNTKMMVRNDIRYVLSDIKIKEEKCLKWEDLDFDYNHKYKKVMFNNNEYILEYVNINGSKEAYIYEDKNSFSHKTFTENDFDKIFFNNMKLEVLENVDS